MRKKSYRDMEPPSTANEITEAYYMSLIGDINRGTSSLIVQRVLHRNGSYKYFTYHLVGKQHYDYYE